MKVTIQLPSILRDECDSLMHTIEFEGPTDLRGLVRLIECEEWGNLVVSDGSVKPPFVLVIDEELAMLKEKAEMEVVDGCVVQVLPLLTGG